MRAHQYSRLEFGLGGAIALGMSRFFSPNKGLVFGLACEGLFQDTRFRHNDVRVFLSAFKLTDPKPILMEDKATGVVKAQPGHRFPLVGQGEVSG